MSMMKIYSNVHDCPMSSSYYLLFSEMAHKFKKDCSEWSYL